WARRERDRFGRDARVRFLVLIGLEVVTAGARVIELVGQDQRVIVAKGVESPDGIRIVRPALVAGDVSLDRPGLAAIPGLVEAEKMVVAFGANDPLAGAD